MLLNFSVSQNHLNQKRKGIFFALILSQKPAIAIAIIIAIAEQLCKARMVQ
jgi:hypothetical protein